MNGRRVPVPITRGITRGLVSKTELDSAATGGHARQQQRTSPTREDRPNRSCRPPIGATDGAVSTTIRRARRRIRGGTSVTGQTKDSVIESVKHVTVTVNLPHEKHFAA